MKKALTYTGYALLLALIIAAFTTTDKGRRMQTDIISNRQTDATINPYVSEVPF